MRWFDSITEPKDMNLSKLREIMKDREARKMTTEVIRDGLRRDEKRQHAQDLGLPKDT